MRSLHVHFSGFSESRALAEFGAAPALGCGCAGCWQAGDFCKGDSRWRSQRNASFLATCRETTALVEARCASDVLLSYRWKSFAHSPLDADVDTYLRASNASRVVAIYAVGPHHFTAEPGHERKWEFVVSNGWMPPQPWIDTWTRELLQLFARLAALRDAGICVLFKTNHIGRRLRGAHGESYHIGHPSAQGGWHDHLNSFASSLAAANGIPVIDVKPITLRANVTQKEGAKAGIAAHDYYHGYDFPALWRLTAARVRRECGLVLRSTAPL